MHSVHRRFFVFILVLLVLSVASPTQAQRPRGGLRYTISVAEFSNQSNLEGQIELGNDLEIVLTDLLQQSNRFIVVGNRSIRSQAMEEQDLAASGRAVSGNNTPQTGYLAPSQLLIKGTITHVQNGTADDSGVIGYGGIGIGLARQKAEINITFYIIETTSGQVVASKSVVGASSKRGLQLRTQRQGADVALSTKRGGNMMSALSSAAKEAVTWMSGLIDTLPWQGSVVRVDDQRVFINRGAREGMVPGTALVVGQLEIIRDPSSGEVLGQFLKEEVAHVEIASVLDKLSICRVTSGDFRAIRSGLTVIFPK